jgi:hypothetical protein
MISMANYLADVARPELWARHAAGLILDQLDKGNRLHVAVGDLPALRDSILRSSAS